jgi:hypothetical protein
MGSVVDENVYPAQLRHGLFYDFPAVRGVLDIPRHKNCFPSGLLIEAFRLVRIFIFVEESDQNIGALARVGYGTARPIPLSAPVMIAFRPVSRPLPW